MEYVEIKKKIHDILQNCSSWRANGYNVVQFVKILKKFEMEHRFEDFDEEDYIFDPEDVIDFEKDFFNLDDDDLPF